MLTTPSPCSALVSQHESLHGDVGSREPLGQTQDPRIARPTSRTLSTSRGTEGQVHKPHPVLYLKLRNSANLSLIK